MMVCAVAANGLLANPLLLMDEKNGIEYFLLKTKSYTDDEIFYALRVGCS